MGLYQGKSMIHMKEYLSEKNPDNVEKAEK